MDLLTLLVMVGMLATLGVLFAGLYSMAHGGEFDHQHSGQFMIARVGVQGFTLLLLLIALYIAYH